MSVATENIPAAIGMSASSILSPAQKRWLRLGPWYAMFPVDFALETITAHTNPGDAVLDPFMGRGTTLAAAVSIGRNASGMEINPIAWIYASTKTCPAQSELILARLAELEQLVSQETFFELPEFFNWAFHPDVVRFLLVAREHLNWRECVVDRTLMAFLLVDLHGKDENALSNQMRQTKSMSPDYAVRWWQERNLVPRQKNPGAIIREKINWRYRHGLPKFDGTATAIHGNSASDLTSGQVTGPFDLLLTSPPYMGVINYHYDQWLRNWLIGGHSYPTNSGGQWQSRFNNRDEYTRLLTEVFTSSAALLKPNARVLVRTDARDATLSITTEVLRLAFPSKHIEQLQRPFGSKTQTHLFGDKTVKPGEVDLLLTPL